MPKMYPPHIFVMGDSATPAIPNIMEKLRSGAVSS